MREETDNLIRTAFILSLVGTSLLAIGAAMGSLHGVWAALVTAALMIGSLWGFADRVTLMSVGARELGPREEPELRELVAELSALMQLPMPRVYLIPTSAPNAFATGRDPSHASLAVTRGLLARLPRDELRAVLAYELGHIVHRDTLTGGIASALAALLLLPARLVGYRVTLADPYAISRRSSATGLALATLLAPLAALVLRLGLDRRREFAADAFAARLVGTGRPLVRALLRIERESFACPTAFDPTSTPLFVVNPHGRPSGIASWFRTHPSTRERVRRLEMMGMAEAFSEVPLLLAIGGSDAEV